MSNRTLPTYTAGLISVANGSRAVTGIGTQWQVTISGLPESQIGKGDLLRVGNQRPIMIESVDSATGITLVENWPHTTVTTGAYEIIRYVPLPSGAVLAALQAMEQTGTDAAPKIAFTWDGGSIRWKLRQSAGGLAEFAVGGTGAADADLVPAWRASATGAVGIGGTPGSGIRFDVQQTLAGDVISRVRNGDTGSTSKSILRAETAQAGTSVDLQVLNNSGTPLWVITGGAATVTGQVKADTLALYNAAGTAAGKLGLGWAPSYYLDLKLPALANPSSSLTLVGRLAGTHASGNSDLLETLHFRASTGSDWTTAEWILRRNVDGSGQQGEVRFGGDYSVKFYTTGFLRMKVDQNGYVGIGQTPTHLLTVGNGSDAVIGVFNGASKSLRIRTDGGSFYMEAMNVAQSLFQPMWLQAASIGFITGATARMTIGTGVQIGTPSGGDLGAGTLNVAGAVYENGSAIGVAATSGVIGQCLYLQNNSGGVIAANGTTSGSNLKATAGITTGFEIGSTLGYGTWRNVNGADLANDRIGMFRRIS